MPSLIFWGPPGCGKTTLARLIAESTKSRFVPFSAVTSGIKEIKEVMGDAVKMRTATGRRTILFVDEIHRFNRAQQDAFLPYVERGDIVLVGATTENPSFELNAALLSRCKVVVLPALGPEELASMLRRALAAPRARSRRERCRGRRRGAGIDHAARQRRRPPGARAAGARGLRGRRRGPRGGDGRGRGAARAAQGPALRQEWRRTLQPHLGVAQVAARKRSRCLPLLAGAHARGRGGSELPGASRWCASRARTSVSPIRKRCRRRSRAGQSYERLGSPEGEVALAQVVIYLALAPKSVAVYRAYGEVQRTDRGTPCRSGPARVCATRRPG